MSLAFHLLALWGVALVIWVLLMILLYWIYRAFYPSRTPQPDDDLTVVSRCTCSDLYVSGVVKDVQDGNRFNFSPQCSIHPSPKDISVRLAGIDAPAMPKSSQPDQPFAQDAADFLAKLIHKKTVYIDKYGMERGIQFAWVFLPQEEEGSLPLNVNLEMVKHGLADVHKGNGSRCGDHKDVIVKLLEEAKDSKRGLWSLINEPNFKRPSDYNQPVRAQQTHKYKQQKSPYAKQNKFDKQSEQVKPKSKQECTIA